MLTTQLATHLRDAGLDWTPTSGDRFVIPDKGMDDEVFHVAEMTIEVHRHHGAGVVKFNGTTEWALDSIPADEVLWLPREDQLRDLLGDTFVALERQGDDWVVTHEVHGVNQRVRCGSVEEAYGEALLALLPRGLRPSDPQAL